MTLINMTFLIIYNLFIYKTQCNSLSLSCSVTEAWNTLTMYFTEG